MNISIISFTKKGTELSQIMRQGFYDRCKDDAEKANSNGSLYFNSDKYDLKEDDSVELGCDNCITLYARYKEFTSSDHPDITPVETSLGDWTQERMMAGDALIFIGAMGIAVRAIAPFVRDKLTDSPVIVADQQGSFVIPVVSGHVGGANALAVEVAGIIGATPVITTATDIEGAFPADVFAKEHRLGIYNRGGVAAVSARALEGRPVRLCIENYPPIAGDKPEAPDVVVSSDMKLISKISRLSPGVLCLCPRVYAVGIGCRRGTQAAGLRDFLKDTLAANDIDIAAVGVIASIDLKKDEPGIVELARELRLPFITFTPQLLEKAVGDFTPSDFVKSQTGVDNVCERSAMLAVGNMGRIVVRKRSGEGMTIAVAKREINKT